MLHRTEVICNLSSICPVYETINNGLLVRMTCATRSRSIFVQGPNSSRVVLCVCLSSPELVRYLCGLSGKYEVYVWYMMGYTYLY